MLTRSLGVPEPTNDKSHRSVETRPRNWPNLFGPSHNGQIIEPVERIQWNSFGPRRVWQATIGRGYSSPVIWDDYLVVLHRRSSGEILECFSTSTGSRRWHFSYPTQFQCRVDYSDGPYATPVIDGKRVFAVGAEGQLYAVDLETGSPIWERRLSSEFDAPTEMFPFGTSPLLEGKLLILAVGGRKPKSGVVAFDVATGQTVWTATDDPRSFATPVAATIHGRRHVFVLTDQGLVSLNPINGELHWRVPFRPKNPDVLMATTPLVHGDLVFVSAYQCGAMCLRVLPNGSYEKQWSDRRSLDSQHNNLIYRDGCVLGFSAREHVLGCVELRTGLWRWKWVSELDRGCLLAWADRLIVFSEKGQLGLLSVLNDSCRFESLPASLLDGPCYSAPAVSGSKIFLRNESTLTCFDMAHKSERVVQATGD